MYMLFSAQTIIDNLLVLVSPYLDDRSDVTPASIRQAYLIWLKKIQPYCPYMDDPTLFYADKMVEQDFSGYFTPEVRVDEVEYQYDSVAYGDPKRRKAALETALAHLTQHDPVFGELFTLIMTSVFCTVSTRLGGTSVNPSYISVMCAYHDMVAEEKTVPELLIHEFTHNAMFLDEHRYGHYTSYAALDDRATYVDSYYAGLPLQLPFDRALHRLIIFAEILMARDRYIGHTVRISQHLNSTEMLNISCWYIDQMRDNKKIQNVMTARCQEIFARLEAFFKSYRLAD